MQREPAAQGFGHYDPFMNMLAVAGGLSHTLSPMPPEFWQQYDAQWDLVYDNRQNDYYRVGEMLALAVIAGTIVVGAGAGRLRRPRSANPAGNRAAAGGTRPNRTASPNWLAFLARRRQGAGAAGPGAIGQGPGVRVVNVGGPLRGQAHPRGLRPDFRHVDLQPGPNTIVGDSNVINLRPSVGNNVRFLRVSNVAFIPVPRGYLQPHAFVNQARQLGVRHVVIRTGSHPQNVQGITHALETGGFRIRSVTDAGEGAVVITARVAGS
jgi:hypothetical protein